VITPPKPNGVEFYCPHVSYFAQFYFLHFSDQKMLSASFKNFKGYSSQSVVPRYQPSFKVRSFAEDLTKQHSTASK
jgi:hypothetical protein